MGILKEAEPLEGSTCTDEACTLGTIPVWIGPEGVLPVNPSALADTAAGFVIVFVLFELVVEGPLLEETSLDGEFESVEVVLFEEAPGCGIGTLGSSIAAGELDAIEGIGEFEEIELLDLSLSKEDELSAWIIPVDLVSAFI